MAHDRYGLELTTTSDDAAAHFGAAVDANLAGTAGYEREAQAALDADAGFALAHAAVARAHQFAGRTPEAQAAKERAVALAPGATRREQQHIRTIAASIEGDSPGALRMVREHIAEFPRDAIILSMANGPFGLIGFGGNPLRHEDLFALLESVAPAYGDDWWFLSAFAFAHNELGHFEIAREMAERAMTSNPGSGHGAHTVAHVHFETGDSSGGAAWLGPWLPGFAREAPIHSHLEWHLALFELLEGHTDRVHDLYERELKPGASTGSPIIAVADAASLLWRQDLYGIERPAGSREAMAEFAARTFPRPGVMFADVHCALAYAAAGDWNALDALVAGLRERVAAGRVPGGEVVPVLAEAAGDFAKGNYARCADTLAAWAPEVIRIGGSNAQREVIEDTLIAACLRAGRAEQAADVLRARLARRPRLQDQRTLATAMAGVA